MTNRPTRIDPINSPSFYFKTGAISADQIQKLEATLGAPVQIVEIPRRALTQVILPPDASPAQGAQFLTALRETVPDARPNVPMAIPSVNPSEATNPNGIPGGGGDGGAAVFTPEQVAAAVDQLRFKHLNFDQFPPTTFPGKATQLIDVVLIDSLPAVDIAQFAYEHNNPTLKSLVHDLQTGMLRFVPTKPQVPPIGNLRLPASGPIRLGSGTSAPPLKLVPRQLPQMSSHGLFSASIIRQLAPGARVTILEALDNTGKGDMLWFTQVLNDTLVEAFPAWASKPLIINLSLVCVWSDEQAALFGYSQKQLYEDLVALLGVYLPKQFEDTPNMRVLAATGNDALPGSELPASLSRVIEVAAADSSGVKAAYSNSLDDGDPSKGLLAFGGPLSGVFVDDKFITGQGAQPNQTGFAQWAGTSFATAIATGIMARLCWMGFSPAEAEKIIRANPAILLK